MKLKIFKFKEVSSTNDVAMNLIKKGKKACGCIYSITQRKGRGTHGKKWISNKGNLFLSIFFPLKKKYPPFNEFSIINLIIISDVIAYFCKNEKITFKWPNDIFVNQKKICGILQEIITERSKKFLIIGIGLNVVSNPNINEGYQATNILKESKKKPSVKKIIELIKLSYEKFFLNIDTYNYKNFKNKIDLMGKYRMI